MKIVFLNHSVSGGGAERVTGLLADKMVDRGHEVMLMTNLFRPFAYTIGERVKKEPLFCSEREAKSRRYLYYMIRNTRRMIMNYNPDVIIGVMPLMNFTAIAARIGLNVKVIASDHTSFERKLPLHIRLIRKYAYRKADMVTVLTQADFDYLGDNLPRKRVMPNPLAYPCVNNVDVLRKKIILAAGRLDEWRVKGFDILIKAWATIADYYPEWKLCIAGGGKESSKRKLVQLADELNVLPRIDFLGFRKDLDAVMRQSSIFVLSSRVEGFGMVLIEAMSQGCACISFDDGGRQREIITSKREGVVVGKHDEKELAEAIRYLIADDNLRYSIAQASVKRAANFSLDIIEKRWEELISELCKV